MVESDALRDRLDLNLPIPPEGFRHPPVPVEPSAVLALCETYLPLITSRPNYWEDRIVPPEVPRFTL
ncbi:MAG: hypothetical protein IT577_10755 [Verrucomicrobiae bacterium]|nr:hypothetical protein [Verrucomicrobiae bacterium]